jgi:hypothetical protein
MIVLSHTSTHSVSPAMASESLSIPCSSQPQGKEDAGGDSVERHATLSHSQQPSPSWALRTAGATPQAPATPPFAFERTRR